MFYENRPKYVPVEKGQKVIFQSSDMLVPKEGIVEQVNTNTVVISGRLYGRWVIFPPMG
jgi:hypothetical protein